ncbi:hypothetical protein DL98DRAFT_520934 [Cadophora sp. DSE1049]|nr:hypothetical protein DL98DRAFT_520934 [Cadophora sp. DSE1049]
MDKIRKVFGRSSATPAPSESTSSALVSTPSAHLAEQPPASTQTSTPEYTPLSTTGPEGISTISNPSNPSLYIVFVHGLTGNRDTTWTHPNGTFWPSLLAQAHPTAKIMTFGYDADVVRLWGMAGSNKLRDHGKALAYAVADQTSPRIPVIFIAHSLGGLVVEQALLLSWRANEASLQDLFSATAAVLFMGTPHSGSALAFWGRTVATYLNMFHRTNREILGVLEPRSEVLAAVEQDFQQMLLKPEIKIDVFCFYEELAMTGVGKVVPEESAILEQYPNLPIHANHSDMTKFTGETDPGFASVCGRLKTWIDKLQGEKAGAAELTRKEVLKDGGGRVYSGSVNSSGGPIFMGDQNAARDQTFNFGSGK